MAMFGDIERKLIKLPQFAHKANGVVGGLAGRCNRPGCQAKPARMASCFATGPISCCLIIYPVCYSDIEVMEVIPKRIYASDENRLSITGEKQLSTVFHFLFR